METNEINFEKKMFESAGETAQVRTVLQVVPDSGRPQVAHVRAQRIVAVQVPRLQPRLQQTHQPQESPVPTHR